MDSKLKLNARINQLVLVAGWLAEWLLGCSVRRLFALASVVHANVFYACVRPHPPAVCFECVSVHFVLYLCVSY